MSETPLDRGERTYRRVWRGAFRGLVLPVVAPGWWVALGGYEPEVAWFTRRLVHPGDLCVDVGCGWGYYTAAMAARGATVIGQDADSGRCPIARNALATNGLAGHIQAREVARIRPGPDVIKMDVEGAEACILEASPEALEVARVVVVEWHGGDQLERCLAELLAAGFKVQKLPLRKGWWRKDVTGERGWLVATR